MTPPPVHGWRRREDGAVVGVFGRHDMTILLRELTALRELICWRLATMPVEQGAGGPVSAELPEDLTLRAVLRDFHGGEPDWYQRWYEVEAWAWLEHCVRITLSDVLACDDGWVEVYDPAQIEAVVNALDALAAIAEHRMHRAAGWLRRCARTLATVDEP